MSAKDGIEAIKTTIDRLASTNKDTFRKRVNTKSNLRSEVLEELLTLCGLSDADFIADRDFIDKELCDPRNEIAHGGGGAPSLITLTQRRDRTFGLMNKLQNTVVNAAISAQFKG